MVPKLRSRSEPGFEPFHSRQITSTSVSGCPALQDSTRPVTTARSCGSLRLFDGCVSIAPARHRPHLGEGGRIRHPQRADRLLAPGRPDRAAPARRRDRRHLDQDQGRAAAGGTRHSLSASPRARRSGLSRHGRAEKPADNRPTPARSSPVSGASTEHTAARRSGPRAARGIRALPIRLCRRSAFVRGGVSGR